MAAAKSYPRESSAENQPRRTLMLFGLCPVHGLTRGRHPSGAYVHADPDRLLLPLTSEDSITVDELSYQEIASAAVVMN